VAEVDETLLEKYLRGETPTPAELKKALRRATISGRFFPVLGGDGRKAIVKTLLDAVIEYLPSPLDLPPVTGYNPKTTKEETREPSESAPFSALAFKIQTDPYVGRLTYIRVYSGKVSTGSYTQNAIKGEKERVGRLLLMHANHREEIG